MLLYTCIYNLWMSAVWWHTWRWVWERDTCTYPHIWRWVPVSSSYLNMSFVWKSMVASYMFVHVADVGMRVFNTFISSTKLFVSSKKCVCIQRLNCSSPAWNVFVCSVILYSEKCTETRQRWMNTSRLRYYRMMPEKTGKKTTTCAVYFLQM